MRFRVRRETKRNILPGLKYYGYPNYQKMFLAKDRKEFKKEDEIKSTEQIVTDLLYSPHVNLVVIVDQGEPVGVLEIN